MSPFLKGAVVVAAALVASASSHARTINLQAPLWDQVRQLECREHSRRVCYPEKLSCARASGSAVWDLDFSKNSIFSRSLGYPIAIKGYAHQYYDQLGTATNTAVLEDGGFLEFNGFDESTAYLARLRMLRNLAGSIVVIEFECQQPGGKK